MKIKFSKMHGAGNDFVILDGYSVPLSLSSEQVRFLADRKFGVGADQVLLIEKPTISGVDFKYRIFNQDGGEVEMCGNGARCFAKYVYDHGLTNKKKIQVQTMKRVIVPELLDEGLVRIDMGIPRFDPETLPFRPSALEQRRYGSADQWKEPESGEWFSICSMGNPHAVYVTADLSRVNIPKLGKRTETLPNFPERANVGFLQLADREHGIYRVWERGVGETLACGTGNCAAFAVARRMGLTEKEAEFSNLGGVLRLEWDQEGDHLYMTGPAVEVFESEIEVG